MRVGNSGQRYGIRAAGSAEASAKNEDLVSHRAIILNGFQLIFEGHAMIAPARRMLIFEGHMLVFDDFKLTMEG
ncbi:MAG: hypothetical protein JWR80_8022 [Bradyrhizobium sp.]|nr:hypothetical protein [Bradyrhizobium sp.]